jgi:putative transposase
MCYCSFGEKGYDLKPPWRIFCLLSIAIQPRSPKARVKERLLLPMPSHSFTLAFDTSGETFFYICNPDSSEEHDQWQHRRLKGKRYAYVWADGVYFNIRAEDERSCMLVIIDVSDTGHKELLGLELGLRESELNWTSLLLRLKDQGLKEPPELTSGDSALGFWKFLHQVFPTTQMQRCWVHKTANVLNTLPSSQQPQAKKVLRDIYLAATKADAETAFDRFIKTYETKYPKTVECLGKDRAALLAFYNFPAEHWMHIRTSNPIESTFATVRLRTDKTKSCVSQAKVCCLWHSNSCSQLRSDGYGFRNSIDWRR